MISDISELNDAELDAVTGGCLGLPLVAAKVIAALKGDGPSGGGSGGANDPAQMFQQILQQLTQGQG